MKIDMTYLPAEERYAHILARLATSFGDEVHKEMELDDEDQTDLHP